MVGWRSLLGGLIARGSGGDKREVAKPRGTGAPPQPGCALTAVSDGFLAAVVIHPRTLRYSNFYDLSVTRSCFMGETVGKFLDSRIPSNVINVTYFSRSKIYICAWVTPYT